MLDILQSQGASAAFSQRYRVTRELGRGGMGQVFLAMDLRSGESVAIKTLLAEADAESLERLRREALALEQIRHPNLVKLLELSLEGRRPFLVMELVVGESLEELIRQAGPVTDKRSFDRRAQWLEEVCSAVAVIHEAGLVHRDIKPSNIMICAKTGRAILLDLGIVGRDRSSDSSMAGALGPTLTKTQQSLGTPHYMAPEQIDSALASLGPRADVWSLGALAFFLVSGEPPYEDCDEVTFFARRMNLAARSLRKLNPFCPRWFSDLAAEALKREPAERLELRALREALAARDFRSSKRPVGLIALAFGLILSLALCGAWIWSSLQRAARQAGKEALEARLREGEGQLEGGRPVPLEALRACAKDYEGLGGGPLLAWAEALEIEEAWRLGGDQGALLRRVRALAPSAPSGLRARLRGLEGLLDQGASPAAREGMLRAADESLMRRAWIRLELARLALTRGSDGAEQALLELATVGSSPEALRLRFEAALQLERSEDCLRLIEGGLAVDNERWPALLALAEKSFPKLLRSLDGPVLRRWLEVCVTAPERLQDGLERLAKQCEDFLRETGPRGVSAQPGAPEDLRCMAVAAESVARLRRGGACDESVYEDVIFGVTQSGTVLRFSREQFASVIELMRALHLWFPDRAKPWMTLLECVGRGFPDDLSAEHARSNLETMREAIPGIRSLRDRWIACWRWLFNVWIYESYDMGANKPIELVTLPSDELRGVDQEIMANAWEILCCIDSLRAWHQGSEHWAAEARRAYEKRKALAKGAADWGLRVRLAGLQRIEKKRALWESEVKQLFAELPGSSTTVAAWDCLIFDLLLAAREEGWDLLEDCYQAILGRAGSESVTSFLGNSSLPWSSLQISRTVQLSGLAAAKREFFTKLPPNFKDLPIMKSIAEELGECTSRAGLYWLLARGINGTRKPGF